MRGQQKQFQEEFEREQQGAASEEANTGQKGHRKRRNRRQRLQQSESLNEYINSKKCEICSKMNKEAELLLCDRCDDGYHLACLDPPLLNLPQEEWVCPVCIVQIGKLQLEKQNEVKPQPESNCYGCKEKLARKQTIKIVQKSTNKLITIQCNTLPDLTCLYCSHTFHSVCFSQRKNSLNCQICEHIIRSKGPKSHDDFMRYIQNSIDSVTKSDFHVLEHSEDTSRKTNRCQKLKIPNYMTSWQFIVQYQASLFYAFVTKGLSFIDEQIYHQRDKELMRLNQPKRDMQGQVLRLHPKDERAYQQFKINSKKGFVGPFEIKQDRAKGFYLTATDYIEPYTIVSEYVGEVMNSRDALNELENDSIFSLLRGARAIESLDIVPQKYGNISRFFAGLNNTLQKSLKQKLENIKSLKFSYRGRVRLLLHTIKPIQAGETLYFDYNGSEFHEYPTEHFVH